eukprot:jgi/Orpsp1_1/1180735/evm.model.c7180000074470.1
MNDFSKFSNNIQYIDCNNSKINYNYFDIMDLYNFINTNIQEIKLININEINKCFEENAFLNNKYIKRENEPSNESDNNSFVIYLIIIIILVALIIGVIVFAIIHRIQDKKKEEQKNIDKKEDNDNDESENSMESMKNMDKKTTGNKNINDEHDITEKVESSDYSSMRNALDEDDNITSKNTENIPSDSSNDYYYKDYCQKSPILYNNKKTNVFDTKNSNLLRMSNRPHSVSKNLKQNRISVNPNCLPEIKIRPESLMLEEEFAKEVSRIFKYYDESLRYSKNSIQSFDSNKTHRINKSQTKESFSSSKRNSRNLQLNRLSKNIKRKKGASALKKRISQNRSLVILPIEPGITPNRKSSLSDYRVSFIQKGTYTHSKSEYYFDHSIGSPESEISSEISPLNSSCSAGSPASIGLTTPTEGNISIDISNMNVKSKNRMSNNAVKTKSNIYQIQQMPYKIQYNDDEANKYESVNITIENTNDSLVDEDSVVLQ